MTPSKNPNDSVPALERGLHILEMVDSSMEGRSFSDLASRLGVANASLNRLLRVLCRLGYLEKTKGGVYRLGERAYSLGTSISLRERLRTISTPLMRELMDASANTVCLFFWAGKSIICLAKEQHEYALSMQQPGAVRSTFLDHPWGVIFFDSMLPEQQEACIAAMKPETKSRGRVILAKQLVHLRKYGFVYDEAKLYRRLAAPIIDRNSRVIASLAIGGTPLSIQPEEILVQGQLLVEYANRLTALLHAQAESQFTSDSNQA